MRENIPASTCISKDKTDKSMGMLSGHASGNDLWMK